MPSEARSRKQKPACGMKMEGTAPPRLPESPGCVKTASHQHMTLHNGGADVIIFITYDTGLPDTERIMKINKLKKQQRLEVL